MSRIKSSVLTAVFAGVCGCAATPSPATFMGNEIKQVQSFQVDVTPEDDCTFQRRLDCTFDPAYIEAYERFYTDFGQMPDKDGASCVYTKDDLLVAFQGTKKGREGFWASQGDCKMTVVDGRCKAYRCELSYPTHFTQ